MVWKQHILSLTARKRGCHLITNEILNHREVSSSLKGIKIGLMHVFIRHTSASLTINENYDPDVRSDMEKALNFIAPENQPYYDHTMEGSDDMPAHIKASVMGSSVSIPITDGSPNMGTWQGIWLCEHRNRASGREVVVTIQGE